MSTAPRCTVRILTESDWETLRKVRLRALADAPSAFETTLADAAAWTEDRWRERARGSATSRLFIADVGSAAVGMAGVYPEVDGSAQVISLWVRPEHRRCGVARDLVAAAVAFATAAGMSRVVLWVTGGNTAARRLYEDAGFRPTGRHQPVSSRPDLEEHEMELPRGAAG